LQAAANIAAEYLSATALEQLKNIVTGAFLKPKISAKNIEEE
jgi:hypothetical protein